MLPNVLFSFLRQYVPSHTNIKAMSTVQINFFNQHLLNLDQPQVETSAVVHHEAHQAVTRIDTCSLHHCTAQAIVLSCGMLV